MIEDAFVFGDSLVPIFLGFMSALVLSGLRLLPVVYILPIFTLAGYTAGLLRGGIVFGLGLFHVPIIWGALGVRPDLLAPIGDLPIILVIGKELFIGIIVACLLSLPFWIATMAGNIIDTQSGEQLGEQIDPGTGQDTTATGTYLGLLAMGIFLEAGFFSLILAPIIADSYAAWPLGELILVPGPLLVGFFSKLLGTMLYYALTIIMPFVVGMFLIDIGLAYTSRFVPSINPFFLSLSFKVLYLSLLHIMYSTTMEMHFLALSDLFEIFDRLVNAGVRDG